MPRKSTAKKATPKKPVMKDGWEQKFYDRLLPFHARSAAMKVKKLMRRLTGIRSTMAARSAKYNVPCTITVEELRDMAYAAYGTPCPYTGRILLIENMVFDHIIPISKSGPSTRENLQVISRFANTMKGSLTEDNFRLLLQWLEQLPEDLRRDVSIRLAGGKR